MKIVLRVLGVFLCIVVFLSSFAGCAGSVKKVDTDAPIQDAGNMLAALTEPLDAFNKLDARYSTAVLDGRLWVLGWGETKGREKPKTMLLSTDGKDAKSVEIALTAPEEETVEAVLLFADAAQLYLLTEHGKEKEDVWSYRLHRLAADGSLSDSVMLDLTQKAYMSQAVVTEDTVWAVGTGELYRIQLSTGACTAIPLPERFSTDAARLTSDGLLLCGVLVSSGAQTFDGGDSAPWLVDVKSGAFSAVEYPAALGWVTNSNGRQVYDTNGLRLAVRSGEEADTLIAWDSKGIWSWDTAAVTARQLYRWLDSGLVAAEIQQVYDLGGSLLYRTTSGDFYRMMPADPDAMQSRTVITVGCVSSQIAGFEELVTTFNRSQQEVLVQTVDYTQQADALDTAILRGEVPDVLLTMSGIENKYLNKGVFRDLYPFIDADPELQRTDFLENILRACETDGKLTTLLPYFGILTAVGPEQKLGAAPGWNWEEYTAACAAEPALKDPIYGFGRKSTLLYHLQMGGSRFIDYAAGKAYLDTPAFAAMLEASKDWSEESMVVTEDPKDRFRSGSALLYTCFINSFDSCRTLRYLFEDGPAYKGFPNDLGTSGSAATVNVCIGITEACQNPDAAWSFVRQFLLPAYQDNFADGEFYWRFFPLRKDSLEKLATAAMQDGWCPTGPVFLNPEALEKDEYWRRGIPAEDAEWLLELVKSVDTVYRYDGVVAEILQEESSRLYAGACTAQEAAAVIQQRVQTYLDERR